jgi:hypothetical protein
MRVTIDDHAYLLKQPDAWTGLRAHWNQTEAICTHPPASVEGQSLRPALRCVKGFHRNPPCKHYRNSPETGWKQIAKDLPAISYMFAEIWANLVQIMG